MPLKLFYDQVGKKTLQKTIYFIYAKSDPWSYDHSCLCTLRNTVCVKLNSLKRKNW